MIQYWSSSQDFPISNQRVHFKIPLSLCQARIGSRAWLISDLLLCYKLSNQVLFCPMSQKVTWRFSIQWLCSIYQEQIPWQLQIFSNSQLYPIKYNGNIFVFILLFPASIHLFTACFHTQTLYQTNFDWKLSMLDIHMMWWKPRRLQPVGKIW